MLSRRLYLRDHFSHLDSRSRALAPGGKLKNMLVPTLCVVPIFT